MCAAHVADQVLNRNLNWANEASLPVPLLVAHCAAKTELSFVIGSDIVSRRALL